MSQSSFSGGWDETLVTSYIVGILVLAAFVLALLLLVATMRAPTVLSLILGALVLPVVVGYPIQRYVL